MNINHPDPTVRASGGDGTSVTDSVQGTQTDSVQGTETDSVQGTDTDVQGKESNKSVPVVKARYKDPKHDGMEKA